MNKDYLPNVEEAPLNYEEAMLHSSWFTKIQIVDFNFNVKFSRGIFNLQEALLDVRSHFCLTKMPHQMVFVVLEASYFKVPLFTFWRHYSLKGRHSCHLLASTKTLLSFHKQTNKQTNKPTVFRTSSQEADHFSERHPWTNLDLCPINACW